MSKVKIGIVGSRFQADCIAASVKMMPDEAEVVAVASPTPGNAEAFAKRHGIPRFYSDYRELLRDPEVELISVTAPNRLHAQITIDAARAGKHVVCEKPLCVTLEEADAMIEACAKAGVLLLYAEELFFAPKYVKAKQMADEGAFGRVHLVKQGEKHSGPHSDWFWDVDQSGGGALMDLGCHGIAFCWWFLGKQKIKSVYAQLSTQVHGARTQGDDEAVTIIEFEDGAIGIVENSWNRPGRDGRQHRGVRRQGADVRRPPDGERARRRTPRSASATRWRRRRRRRGGRIRCSRSTGTTASRRRCGTSRAACAARRRRSRTARRGASCRRCCTPRTRRRGSDGRSSFPSARTGIAKPIDLWKRPELALSLS